VSTNDIIYPADIHCENCNEKIAPVPFNIEPESWDLKCPHCKKTGYKHPKSAERKQQIIDMLDMIDDYNK
jgi:Zn finger protein HypA/HybF involved in hydrogenase expression